MGLAGSGRKKAGKFSLGQKQRLGIALALVGDPDFLILDEPINGLDPQGIAEVRRMLEKLNEDRGITILISSHILEELSKLATHYGFIDKGQIVREMSAEELENECRKCVRVKVTDTAALARVLDGMDMEYKIIDDEQADIFASPNITKLAFSLWEEKCEILSVSEHDENLEGFFISLVGGGSNE